MDSQLVEQMLKYHAEGLQIPLLTLFRLTTGCNAKCLYCRIWSRKKEDLPMDLIRSSIDDLYELGGREVRLTGGEPTMSPNFLPSIEYARKNGLQVSYITNGSADENVTEESMRIGTKRVYISIDSPYADCHDNLRRTDGLFESAMRTIDSINLYNDKHGTDTKIVVNMVVGVANFNQLPAMAELCMDKAVDELNPLQIKGKFNRMSVKQIRTYNSEIVPRLENVLNGGKLRIKSGDPFIFGTTEKEMEASSKGDYTGTFYRNCSCAVSSFSSFVDEKGGVYICSNGPYLGEGFKIGSLEERPFGDIWHGEAAKKARERCATGLPEKCTGCDGANVSANRIAWDAFQVK